MSKLTWVGAIGSALWAVFVFKVVKISPTDLGLNEWGDFAAGFVSPLALFWLVIGYFQQSHELRLNTQALKLQHEELQRQVEETAELARNSDRQAAAAEQMWARQEALDSAPPVFIPDGTRNQENVHTFNLRNVGASVADLTLVRTTIGQGVDVALSGDYPVLRNNDRITLKVEPFQQIAYPYDLVFSYRTQVGRRLESTVTVVGYGQVADREDR